MVIFLILIGLFAMAEQQFEETLDEQVQLMIFIANCLKNTTSHFNGTNISMQLYRPLKFSV